MKRTLLVVGLLSLVGCADDGGTPTSPSPVQTTTAVDGGAAQASNEAAALAAPVTIGAASASYEAATDLPPDATFDPTTGFWQLTKTLPFNMVSEMETQFQDAAGNVQRSFVPGSTAVVLTRGMGSGDKGSITWDLTLTDVDLSTATYTVNGNGTVTTMGMTGTYRVDDVIMPTSGQGHPQSGTATILFDNGTVTIQFNGTNMAPATYMLGGVTVNFTINLDTGEIIGL